MNKEEFVQDYQKFNEYRNRKRIMYGNFLFFLRVLNWALWGIVIFLCFTK